MSKEIASREIQKIIKAEPSWFVRWGSLFIFFILVVIALISTTINYSDTTNTTLTITSLNSATSTLYFQSDKDCLYGVIEFEDYQLNNIKNAKVAFLYFGSSSSTPNHGFIKCKIIRISVLETSGKWKKAGVSFKYSNNISRTTKDILKTGRRGYANFVTQETSILKSIFRSLARR